MTGFKERGIKNPRKEPEMAKKYRIYSIDFKKQLVGEIDSGVTNPSEAARNHGISRSLIERWMDQIHGGTLIEKPTTRERQLEKDLEKAQAKIGQLTMIIDALKKIKKSSAFTRESNGCVVTGENWASRLQTGVK
jgi:transposase-like protein